MRLLARFSFASLASLVTAAAVAAACSSTDTTSSDTPDSSTPDRTATPTPTPPPSSNDSGSPGDAGADAKTAKDASGPGEAGADCSFNRDCQAALRCECDEVNGCACKTGARGTGQNGIDPCDGGNQCASAVCVEGPPDAGFFCSDECTSPAECGGKLPQCTNVAFVGQICVRTPPN